MAFTIKVDEGVKKAFRRLARNQLGQALDALNGSQQSRSERVHEVRTSIKKVRALIDVANPSGGRAAARAHQKLRKVAAAVAPLRDGDVSLTTFDGLLPQVDEVEKGRAGSSLRRARRHLAARLRAAGGSFDEPRRLEKLARRLRRARRRTARWIPVKKGWRHLRDGLFAGYRRARKAKKRAYAENTGTAFHHWRRAVKAHRYQMQLLEDLWPGEATAHVQLLERLGELLGQEHDLTVLEETIAGDSACRPNEEGCARLLALIERRRHELRMAARPLGDTLFAESSRAFRRRLRDEVRAGNGLSDPADVDDSAADDVAGSGQPASGDAGSNPR